MLLLLSRFPFQPKHRKPFSAMNKKYLKQILRERIALEKKRVQNVDDSVNSLVNSESNSNSSRQSYSQNINLVAHMPLFPHTLTVSQSENTLQQITIPSSSQNHQESLARSLTNWAVSNNISQTSFSQLLAILKMSEWDINEYRKLPSDCRTLLKTENKKHSIITFTNGAYYHFGLLNGVEYVLNSSKINIDCDLILVNINIDGLPLTKSSSSQFWPVLGSLELRDCDRPFVIGVYHGLQKPSHASDILKPLLDEYDYIKSTGLSFNGKILRIKFSKFILDAPAKSFLLGVKGHNSYHGCTKCTTEGTFINNRMSYPDLYCPLRTDEGFRSGIYDDWHLGQTPLLSLDIDMIKSFPLDYMHLACLGVMKRLLLFWTKGNVSIRMSKTDLNIMSQHLRHIRKYMNSDDFCRLPRSLDEIERWKASEFRQFLLYTGPIVAKNRIKHSQYIHFLSLHCAFRILCTPDLCFEYNNFAKQLLLYFVRNFSKLYGSEFITHNIHNLIHLCDDVLLYGALDNFSAFKFENYMSEIKRMLKTCKNPLQQFINRLHESRKLVNYKFEKNFSLLRETDTYYEPLLFNGLVKSYEKIKIHSYTLGPGLKNNHCILKNGVVVRICKIIQCLSTNETYFVFNRYESFENYFSSPCESKMFHCGKVDNLSSINEILPIKEILTKVIYYKKLCISFLHNI